MFIWNILFTSYVLFCFSDAINKASEAWGVRCMRYEISKFCVVSRVNCQIRKTYRCHLEVIVKLEICFVVISRGYCEIRNQ